VAAAAARLALLLRPPSPALDLAYAMARHWGADPANVVPAYSLQSALWWQRPLAFDLMSPFAALGPLPFRAAIALAASVLPALIAVAVLRWQGRPAVAAVVGLAAALFPPLVHVGVDAWPATLAATFAVGTLLAAKAGRPALAGALAAASAWSHPAGLATPLVLFAVASVRAARRKEARLYPLELDRPATAAAAATLLGVLPSAAAWLLLGGPALLATASADAAIQAGFVLLAPWVLLFGAWAAGRALLSGAWADRGLAANAAVAAAAVLAAALALPPLAAVAGDGLGGVRDALGPAPWGSVLLVDVDWRLVPHPFADHAGLVGWSYTTVAIPLDEWVHAVEGSGHTVLAKEGRPLNAALRSAYAECVVHEDARYVVLDGACTPGHGDAFRAQMEQNRSAASPP
jgi:hypothetical protein